MGSLHFSSSLVAVKLEDGEDVVGDMCEAGAVYNSQYASFQQPFECVPVRGGEQQLATKSPSNTLDYSQANASTKTSVGMPSLTVGGQ